VRLDFFMNFLWKGTFGSIQIDFLIIIFETKLHQTQQIINCNIYLFIFILYNLYEMLHYFFIFNHTGLL